MAVTQANIQGDLLSMSVEYLLGPRLFSGKYSNENYLILWSWELAFQWEERAQIIMGNIMLPNGTHYGKLKQGSVYFRENGGR